MRGYALPVSEYAPVIRGDVVKFLKGSIMSKKLVTAEEIAQELRVSPSTIIEWGRQGKIPRVKISPKIIRYDKDNTLLVLSQGLGTNDDR